MRVECLQRARPKTDQQSCRRWDWLTRVINRVCLSTGGISQGEKQLERRSKINRSEKKRTITVSQHWIGVKFMHGQVQHTLYQLSAAIALVEGIYQKRRSPPRTDSVRCPVLLSQSRQSAPQRSARRRRPFHHQDSRRFLSPDRRAPVEPRLAPRPVGYTRVTVKPSIIRQGKVRRRFPA